MNTYLKVLYIIFGLVPATILYLVALFAAAVSFSGNIFVTLLAIPMMGSYYSGINVIFEKVKQPDEKAWTITFLIIGIIGCMVFGFILGDKYFGWWSLLFISPAVVAFFLILEVNCISEDSYLFYRARKIAQTIASHALGSVYWSHPRLSRESIEQENFCVEFDLIDGKLVTEGIVVSELTLHALERLKQKFKELADEESVDVLGLSKANIIFGFENERRPTYCKILMVSKSGKKTEFKVDGTGGE